MAYIGKKPTDKPLASGDLAADLVDGTKIADNAVDSEHIAADSIDAEHYAAGSVDATAIGDDEVNSQHYAAASIDNEHLANDAVDSDELKAGAIDDAHFAAGTIVGKQTIWIPANAMNPTESNGCASITAVETTSGRPDMQVLDFDKDSDEHAQFTVAFPKSWNLGTITYQVFWSGLAATTGVTWALQGVGMGDNETIDVVYGTAITVDDDAQSAVEELLVSAESSAVTIAGTPADDDLTYFRIYRNVSAGNDDMAGDARLHGVKIFFTTDALNDA